MRLTRWLLIALGWGWAAGGIAGEPGEHPRTIPHCHAIADEPARVRCYDAVTDREKYLRAREAAQRAQALAASDADKTRSELLPPAFGILGELWGLDRPAKDSRFEVKQYQPNYIIAYNTNPFNSAPQTSDTRVYNNQPSTDPSGLNFQISAKVRVFDGREDNAFGLWLAYTQQSWWQVFDAPNSRPFRETNYQPEAIIALRPQLFGAPNDGPVVWRLLNFGFAHQSNGQSGNASRSWNRVYAEAAVEHDWDKNHQLAVAARVWSRIGEDPNDDENPKITDYLGYGDLRAIYRQDNWLLTAMVRGNVRTSKGAVQIGLAVPLGAENGRSFPFKVYIQFFKGYGESLLDYNWKQTTLGIGFMLNERR